MPTNRPKEKAKPARRPQTSRATPGKKKAEGQAVPAKKAPKPEKVRQRRPRRTTDEIIDLIIAAATEEFELNGYMGATTAAIAKRAEVAEALIFVHFGTKARLFHDTIFKPLNRHVAEFCMTHLVDRERPEVLASETKEYITQMQMFIEQHSQMLTSFVVANLYPAELQPKFSQADGLNEYFARASELGQKRPRKPSTISLPVMARLAFAATLAPVMFKKWLFPEGLISDADLSLAITNFVYSGLQA
jgi:AcrR family transcriptional regulator